MKLKHILFKKAEVLAIFFKSIKYECIVRLVNTEYFVAKVAMMEYMV